MKWKRFESIFNKFFSSYLPRGNVTQRLKLKNFLTLLDVFEFGSFENFTQLNLKEWSFDHINVYDIYRRVGKSCTHQMTAFSRLIANISLFDRKVDVSL